MGADFSCGRRSGGSSRSIVRIVPCAPSASLCASQAESRAGLVDSPRPAASREGDLFLRCVNMSDGQDGPRQGQIYDRISLGATEGGRGTSAVPPVREARSIEIVAEDAQAP